MYFYVAFFYNYHCNVYGKTLMGLGECSGWSETAGRTCHSVGFVVRWHSVYELPLLRNHINRDYDMAIFIPYPISTRDTHISPRAFGPRADMGVSAWYGVCYSARGLIWVSRADMGYAIRPEGWYGCLGLIWGMLFGPRADMGVSGWYGVWYENCHIIIYLSYIFLIWYRMRSQRRDRRMLRMWWYGFIARAKKPYHPRDPLSHFFFFCAPQEWCAVLESHPS